MVNLNQRKETHGIFSSPMEIGRPTVRKEDCVFTHHTLDGLHLKPPTAFKL